MRQIFLVFCYQSQSSLSFLLLVWSTRQWCPVCNFYVIRSIVQRKSGIIYPSTGAHKSSSAHFNVFCICKNHVLVYVFFSKTRTLTPISGNRSCTLIHSFIIMLSPLHLRFDAVQLPCNPPDGTAVVQLSPPCALLFFAYAPAKRIAGHLHRAVKFVVHHFHTITTAVQAIRHTLTNSQTSIACRFSNRLSAMFLIVRSD